MHTHLLCGYLVVGQNKLYYIFSFIHQFQIEELILLAACLHSLIEQEKQTRSIVEREFNLGNGIK